MTNQYRNAETTQEAVFDALIFGLEQYVAGLFQVYLSDPSTTERLELGIRRAVTGFGEALRVADAVLGETSSSDDQET